MIIATDKVGFKIETLIEANILLKKLTRRSRNENIAFWDIYGNE